MPELAELKISAEFVDHYGRNNRFLRIEKSSVSKVKTDLSNQPFGEKPFQISAKSRGKEMVVTFTDPESGDTKDLKVTLGMSGGWVYFHPEHEDAPKALKHAHLRFITEAGKYLALVDARRFAKWSWGSFSEGRGPCPLSEHSQFRTHILNNYINFVGKIHEVMMNQAWFNGIGNYLRAEILYRADVDPFQEFSKLTKEEVEKLLDLCLQCTQDAYALGGGQLRDWKNPQGTSAKSFQEWILCYNLKTSESVVDSAGRRFWYHPKWKP